VHTPIIPPPTIQMCGPVVVEVAFVADDMAYLGMDVSMKARSAPVDQDNGWGTTLYGWKRKSMKSASGHAGQDSSRCLAR
jgi:hypothetical protein